LRVVPTGLYCQYRSKSTANQPRSFLFESQTKKMGNIPGHLGVVS
jgi:hypothetical protein